MKKQNGFEVSQPQNAVFRGQGANGYLGFGILSFYNEGDLTEIEGEHSYLGKEKETERFLAARESASAAMREMAGGIHGSLGKKEREIFGLYADLCMDEDLCDGVLAHIDSGTEALSAIRAAADELARRLESIEDDYLRERGSDIRNAAREIIRHADGRKESDEAPRNAGRRIIVANDLSPADTVRIDKSSVAGFVLFGGSRSSHTSILSRALGIPCITGCERIEGSYEGEFAVIDAESGILTVNPDVEVMREFAHRASLESEAGRRLEALRYSDPISKSGRRMQVFANLGSVHELENAYVDAVSGCGLFRSEFIFLEAQSLPDEEEQFEVYKRLLTKMGERLAVIRVLDVGADKIPSYLASECKEENPALGIRGIRFLLANRTLFKSQLRAIIRASRFGNAAILIPMVTCAEEIYEVKELIAEVKNELRYAEIDFAEKIPLGIMIETPASAIMSDRLAPLCDFFSVGTNDLCQYTLAADRQNPAVDHLIDKSREPIIRLIAHAAECIHREGGWIGICGEMASDTSLTEGFLDMGIDEISVSLPYVLKMKQAVIKAK